jgi:hypothetical protein
MRTTGTRGVAVLVAVVVGLVGCGSEGRDEPTTVPTTPEQRFPVILDVVVAGGGGSYDFTVTISSPYDTAQRYADGWRVMGNDGSVYGEHTLTHDHATEQPFTRTQVGVAIPVGVSEVLVEGRDSANGYGGDAVTVDLP